MFQNQQSMTFGSGSASSTSRSKCAAQYEGDGTDSGSNANSDDISVGKEGTTVSCKNNEVATNGKIKTLMELRKIMFYRQWEINGIKVYRVNSIDILKNRIFFVWWNQLFSKRWAITNIMYYVYCSKDMAKHNNIRILTINNRILRYIAWFMLGNDPAHDINGPHVAAQGLVCKSWTHEGAGRKLPPPPLLYI